MEGTLSEPITATGFEEPFLFNHPDRNEMFFLHSLFPFGDGSLLGFLFTLIVALFKLFLGYGVTLDFNHAFDSIDLNMMEKTLSQVLPRPGNVKDGAGSSLPCGKR